MNKLLTILAFLAYVSPSNAQAPPYKDPLNKTGKVNCFEEFYNAFITRGAIKVEDGKHDVVFSARKNGECFCGEGTIVVKNTYLIPVVEVKKEDGTYEPAKKKLHIKLKEGETAETHYYRIENGMTETFLTEDEYLINIFFIDALKRKVVPNAVAPSPDDISGIQIQLTPKEKEIIKQAYDGLKFENGKAVIMPSSFATLDLMAGMLTDKPEYKLNIIGYTDNIGHADFNLTLSQNRAIAVKDYLLTKGLEPTRLMTEGHGEENPIGDNTTAEGRALNRRVDFIVVK